MKPHSFTQIGLFISASMLLASQLSCLAALPTGPLLTPAIASRTAAGNSHLPVFSEDGRRIVFVSQANNLVANDDLGPSLDVFVRDLIAQETVLVSVNTNGLGGANLDANYPAISSNGQYVAFASMASNLAPNDTNRVSDVFVRDLAQGITHLVSVAQDGISGANGKSGVPSISADGQWIVFESAATNLVDALYPSDAVQVYARDWQSGTTLLLSIDATGTGPGSGKAESPSTSADARRVAFVSTSTNLVSGVTNPLGEIYVRDRETGATLWASADAGAWLADATNGYRCQNPVLSRDGLKLAFKAVNLDTNLALVFWHDLETGTSVCVASNSLDSTWPALSADGRFVAFEDGPEVMVWDSVLHSGQRISVRYDGLAPANGPSHTPVMSADAQTVVFFSRATDLLADNPPDSNQVCQVYARNLALNQTLLVSATLAGQMSSETHEFSLPAVSPDGRFVAFESESSDLVSNDLNRATDVFIRDLETESTEPISTAYPTRMARTGTGVCSVHPNCLSADGRFALISSSDNTVVLGDDNGFFDLYRVDLLSGGKTLIAVPTNDIGRGGALNYPVLSADGSTAAFVRKDYPSYNHGEGYWFDSATGTSTLFNLNPTGAVVRSAFPRTATSYGAGLALSPDGSLLTFNVETPELVEGMAASYAKQILLRDLVAGTNMLLTHIATNTFVGGNSDSTNSLFSPDGRWLLFYSKARDLTTNLLSAGTKLFARDLASGTLRDLDAPKRYLDEVVGGTVFSANSQYVVYFIIKVSGIELYRHDLLATNPINVLVATNARNPSVSGDGQLVVYESPRTNSPISDIFLTDLESGNVELISVSLDGLNSGNGTSLAPQISADGRFVVFASQASDLAPNDRNQAADVFLRDRALGLTYVVSANPQTGASGNRASHSPMMSADGSTVIFASWASDLIEGDFNDKQDVFVLRLSQGDSDADGLDDAWELAYFGDLSRDGSGDADGDGLSDQHELRAGTDPTNQGSVLRALVMASLGGQRTTLLWPAAQGRQYQVQFKRSLTDTDWTDLTASVTVTGNTASAVDDEAGLDAARFYRIVLLP